MERLTNLRKETLDGLQELIAYNLDSAELCDVAAKRADAVRTGDLFREIGGERRQQAIELQQFVRMDAEEPRDKGTAGGSIRKVWVDLRAAINRGDKEVIAIEAERAEDRIKSKYEDVLRETAGSPVNDVLMRQYARVKGWHDRVKAMRDAIKTSVSRGERP